MKRVLVIGGGFAGASAVKLVLTERRKNCGKNKDTKFQFDDINA